MASIGQVIDDKYEILKLIGKGGMSKVYLAMDKRLNKQWAIKEIEKNARDKNNEVVIQSAIAEANLIKQLDHPAIVRIVDIIDDGNVIYIVEDYIEGETLSSIIENNGAQPQEYVIEWAMQICEAFEYLHTRKPPIIYRDMKPANVMLKPDGNIKIIDFGIAREYKEQSLADTISLGTKGYAAPEQFGGKGQTDARTDVYCLGVTLYHLVTGQNPCEPPYEIYPIRNWNPQLSAGLEAIIQKCTQLNPDDRYQTCAELLYALHHYEEYGAAYRARQKKKLISFAVTLSLSVLFFIVGALGLLFKAQTLNADYNQNIAQAEKASSSAEMAEYYGNAIDIKPEESEAYLGMINAFKEDADYTLDEEKAFKQKINTNISELRKQPGYANLAFETGKMYWYYYDYGKTDDSDNQITRIKSAVQWFDDVVKYGNKSDSYYKIATVYRDIGTFNRDITLNIEEASDKGKYSPYWNNIEELVSLIKDEDNEMIELEVYKLAMYSIETYARKFKNDGISRNKMTSLLDNVEKGVSEISTTSDKTEELKEEVQSRIESARLSIENAFRERE
ncbi:MAG: serine/threonine protein kinase [Clostridia bacterium]|nr:serine/threonine protein kinase [Clostridia bacterium]